MTLKNITLFSLLIFLLNKNEIYCKVKASNMKYVLMWTGYYAPFKVEGQKSFISSKCMHKNCYLTSDKQYFADFSKFDAVIFHGPHLPSNLTSIYKGSLPRTPNQNFIFFTFESPFYYPLCNSTYGDFFNTTWTYRLDSDLQHYYFSITNEEGEIIGPAVDINWLRIDDMKPINQHVKIKLETKYKPAMWLVSRCHTANNREGYVSELQNYIEVDIHGYCVQIKICDDERKLLPNCFDIIESDYYFYLAFENSFAEDYVTEKLLHALNHYAVPIVYGGANYSRFLPDGSYINARDMSPRELATLMMEIINDKERYHDLFRWHNHYRYKHAYSSNGSKSINYCMLCEFMNHEHIKLHNYENIDAWYTPPECCPKKQIQFMHTFHRMK